VPRRGVRQGQDPGLHGIDIAVASEADVRHDLGVFPYPVESDAYDAIFCRNVIEHVPNVVRLMEEIHRAGRPGAEVFITTPHFSSVYSYQDPTHVRHLSYESLDYFTTDTRHSNFYTDRRFEMVEREMDFGKSFPSRPSRGRSSPCRRAATRSTSPSCSRPTASTSASGW